MNFSDLFQFLSELQQNNNKEWMDTNRKWYQQVRNSFIHWLDQLEIAIAKIDPDYYPTSGRKGMNRINNNLLFHPNKPVYKDHFAAGLDQRSKQGDFYIQIGINDCEIAGGYWNPKPNILQSIREAIDYNGEELVKIIHKKSFLKTFGGLYEDKYMLKKAPKGYTMDHTHIDLLRLKTIAVIHPLTKEQILQDDINERILEIYKEMLPFRRYLNQAVTV